jgi:hypothetical protein
MLAIEIAIVFPVYIFTFSPTQYRISEAASDDARAKHYYGGFLGHRAIFDALNIFDIFIALGRRLQAKLEDRQSGSQQYSPPPSNYYALNEDGEQYYPNRSQVPLYSNQGAEYGVAPQY